MNLDRFKIRMQTVLNVAKLSKKEEQLFIQGAMWAYDAIKKENEANKVKNNTIQRIQGD